MRCFPCALFGVATSIATFGAINNTVNTVYYNYISDGKSKIDESCDKSAYVDGYISRWERLDYTKQMTQETNYNANAWRYHSEYSVHMYGWYVTSWSMDKDIPVFSSFAVSFQKADVSLYEWDSRPHVAVGTALWGMLGL